MKTRSSLKYFVHSFSQKLCTNLETQLPQNCGKFRVFTLSGKSFNQKSGNSNTQEMQVFVS